MASLGTLSVDVTANLANAMRGFDRLERRMSSLGTNARRAQSSTSASTIAMGNAWAKLAEVALRAIAKITTAMVKLIQTGSKMAIMYETNMQQIDRLFGNSANVITDFADEQARAMGISQNSVISYARTFGSLFKNLNKSKAETAELAKVFVKTAAVIKSNEPRFTMEHVMDKLRSGILGNTQAIDDLGIEVKIGMLKTTKAFKKFAGDKSWAQLDFKTQNQIRMFAILEQSANVFGTSIRKNTNASLQVLNATLDDFKLKLGQAFLPIIQRTVPILIKFAETLVDVGEKIRLFSNYLFEVEEKEKMLSDSGDDAAGSQEGLSDEIDKAAKSASKSLAPFDKLNNLQEKIAMPSGISTTQPKTSDVLDDLGIGGDDFIGPMPGKDKPGLSDEMKGYIDGMKDGFKEVQTEAQNNRKWLKNFWKTSIITDSEAKEIFSTSGFKTYNELWERFYSEPLIEAELDTIKKLDSMDMKHNEFFTGLQQKPWNDVKMNWFTGMQNIKSTMDIVLSRMDKNVDTHIEGIKNKDWTGVQTEWDNSWGDIRTDIDTQLGNIETDVQDTVFNIQKEVEKAKMALASITGSQFNGIPISGGGSDSFSKIVGPDFNSDFLEGNNGNFGTDTSSRLTQVPDSGLPVAPINLTVVTKVGETELARTLVGPLQKEMERKGNNMIKSGQVNNAGFAGGGN